MLKLECKARVREEFMEVPFEVKAEDVLEDGTIKGYASLFDKTPDSYGDIIARAALILADQRTIAAAMRNVALKSNRQISTNWQR